MLSSKAWMGRMPAGTSAGAGLPSSWTGVASVIDFHPVAPARLPLRQAHERQRGRPFEDAREEEHGGDAGAPLHLLEELGEVVDRRPHAGRANEEGDVLAGIE